MPIRESLFLVEKLEFNNDKKNNNNLNNKNVINVKKSSKSKIGFSPNKKNKDIDKRINLANQKSSKEESQRGLISNFSVK